MNASWIDKWQGANVFVLGDIMLDKFVYGNVERISPEAPIPVLHYQDDKSMPGGSANVARNIVSLGGSVFLVGVIGNDPDGDMLSEQLISCGIGGHLVRLSDHPTTVKVRYVSGGQQIMRLDIERPLKLDAQTIEDICLYFADVAETISAVVLSDYAKGVLDPLLIRRVIDLARARNIPIVVDPKSRDVDRYAGATVLTPNAVEAGLIAGVKCLTNADAESAAKIVCDAARVESVVLTRGSQGMTIWDPRTDERSATHMPSIARDVFDVSGAGDTVVAALSLALGSGASVTSAAQIANSAAGIAVGKRGTAVVRAQELANALGGAKTGDNPKILADAEALDVVAGWKSQGLRVGFTNGCFDLLHPGHVQLLKGARATCDRLVVALNSDASVRRLKGETRPVQNEYARSIVMAALDSVDLVMLFSEDTPMRLIQMLKPDQLIKGGDYTRESVVGADFVASYGGSVVLVPLEIGHSTTSIIARANVEADS